MLGPSQVSLECQGVNKSGHQLMRGLRLVAVCVLVAGAVLSIVAWWSADPVSNQDAPHSDSPATSGALAVQYQSGVEPVRNNAGITAPHLEPPPSDLVEAITRAQAASGSQLLSPTEQSSEQPPRPRSPEEAGKFFEDAVKALEKRRQLYSSPVSPFGPFKK